MSKSTAVEQYESGADSWPLRDAGELVERLRTIFGLDLPQVRDLWPGIVQRHAEFVAMQS